MYHNNINLSLTFLGFFLITNVFGAPGTSGLAKNQTSDKIQGKIVFSPKIRHCTLECQIQNKHRILDNKLHRDRNNSTFSKILPQHRKNFNKEITENNTIALGYNFPSDDPKFGKLENLLC